MRQSEGEVEGEFVGRDVGGESVEGDDDDVGESEEGDDDGSSGSLGLSPGHPMEIFRDLVLQDPLLLPFFEHEGPQQCMLRQVRPGWPGWGGVGWGGVGWGGQANTHMCSLQGRLLTCLPYACFQAEAGGRRPGQEGMGCVAPR